MDVLREIRIRQAEHLLTMTDLPVKIIAARVGFASRSHFSRAFTAFHHVTPSEYRDASQNAEPGGRTYRSPIL